MLRDPKRFVEALAELIDEFEGCPDDDKLQQMLTLSLSQAANEDPNSLLPYEVLLIRIGKYVASQLPAPIYRDRARRAQIRRRVSDLLIAQGLDPSGARIRA